MALRTDDSESEDQLAFSSAESDAPTGLDAAPARQRSKPTKLRQKDDEELELERLVFGNKVGFRQNLFKDDEVLELKEAQGQELELAGGASDDDNDHENLDDADLFMWDAAVKAPVAGDQVIISGKLAQATEHGPQPAWEDSDDENLTVSLATVSRLRRLRQFEGEDVITGTEYARRLRNEYLRMNPLPGWVRDAEQRPAKRRRRSSAASDQSLDSLDSDEGSDLEAEPLEEFLRDVRLLANQGSKAKKRPLRPEIINIQQTRRIPNTHTAAVSSLSFHPQHPVLLSASSSSIIYLHRIAPTAHPTPNPALTSVLAKGVDVRRAEFLGQGGGRVLFAGRRPYYHRWDLGTGAVERVSQVTGHQRDHRSMERFRASPCGRYVAIAGTGKKGGGSVNIVDAETTLWVAEARLEARHGVADFVWWADGEGLTVLGRDGHVGEYSLARRRFVGVWRDEGSFDTTVVALGGYGGPGSLGRHRYVAVGSGSGIVNLYDRREMVIQSSDTTKEEGGDEAVEVKERPLPAKRFEQLVTGISHLAFSPDGQLLLFASGAKQDSLRLVHVSSRTVYRNWPTGKTPIGRVSAVAFGRQSDMLAVGNDKGTIRLWEIRC